MKKKKESNVEQLMKAMAIELLPIEELKKPVAHPENFDLFMVKAIKIKPKVKTKKKWMLLCEKYDKYNRVFVLKHGIYIIIYSLVCALLLEIISYFSFIYKSNVNFNWQFYLNNWNMNIAFLSNPNSY